MDALRNNLREIARQKVALLLSIVSLFVLIISIGLLTYTTTNVSTSQSPATFAYTPGATNTTDITHYIQKYGFYRPTTMYVLSSADATRLKAMMPFVFKATDAFNAQFINTVEPELIVWWTYAEGIGGRISFSNCNDRYYAVANCYHPSSWQLGYGIQFSAIGLLTKAFIDTHGNPNDALLVQKVGQNILNIDKASHTTPLCGGYTCTFPTLTIDQIMQGVSTSYETTNNWWASVLSRDPAINAYIDASALQVSQFNRSRAFGWGPYYVSHWQQYSNDLATILKNWQALGGCPQLLNCYIPKQTATHTSVAIPTQSTPSPIPTSLPTYFLPTATLTLTPTQQSEIPFPTSSESSPTYMPPTQTPSPTPLSPTALPSFFTYAAPPVTPTPTSLPTDMPEPTDISFVSPTQGAENSNQTPSLIPSPSIQLTIAPIPQVTLAPTVQPTPTPKVPVHTSPTSKTLTAASTTHVTGIFLFLLGFLGLTLLAIPTTRKRLLFLLLKLLNPVQKNQQQSSQKEDIIGTYSIHILEEGTETKPTWLLLHNDTGDSYGYFYGKVDNNSIANIQGKVHGQDSIPHIFISSLQPVQQTHS